MYLFLALNLGFSILFVLADNGTNTSCTGCRIDGEALGILWDDLYNFMNETVYVDIETTDNSTTTISRVPNPDARSSFSSICTSRISSNVNPAYGDIRDCHSNGVWTFSGKSYGVSFSWEMTYPTSYLIPYEFVVVSSSLGTFSGQTSCSASAKRNGLTYQLYPIHQTDTSWLSVWYNSAGTGNWVTYLGQMPYGAYSTISDLNMCLPGSDSGIPVTKIAIIGTASTVYHYKTGAEPAISPALPSAHPPASIPSATAQPNNPHSSENNLESNVPTRAIPGQAVPPTITPQPEASNLLPSGKGYILPNGGTLHPGDKTTILGTLYSLYPNTNEPSIIIGTSTIRLLPNSLLLPYGYSLFSSSAGILLPNGGTLRVGGATTVNGVPVSFAGTAIVSGNRTYRVTGSETVGWVKTDDATGIAARQNAGIYKVFGVLMGVVILGLV